MKTRFLIALMALSAAANSASAQPTAYQAAIAQCLLTVEVAMAISDKADPDHAVRARQHLASLEAIVPVIKKKSPDVEVGMKESLQAQVSTLNGQLLRSGYDTTAHLTFVMAQRDLMANLTEAIAREGVSGKNKMALEICDIVGNYLLITTSPLGPDNVSAFNNDESDFEKRVSSIDLAFDQISRTTPAIASLRPKWDFIRPALLNRNRISTPFVVYRSGTAVVNGILGYKENTGE